MPLTVTEIVLSPPEEKKLLRTVRDSVAQLVTEHAGREEMYARWRRMYRAKPEHEVKNFPWPGASNVVIPLIGMTVDAIVARLMRAMLGTQDFCEVSIKSPAWENVPVPPDPADPAATPKTVPMEKEIRDWITHFVSTSGTRDRIRTFFADATKLGDAFVKPIWVEENRIYHAYDDSGQVVELPVPDYVGVRWTVPAPDDIIPPRGFDEWNQLPFIIHRVRYTWSELLDLKEEVGYRNIEGPGTDTIEGAYNQVRTKTLRENDAKERNDRRHTESSAAQDLRGVGPAQIFEFLEIQGKFSIPVFSPQTDTVEGYKQEHVILTYSLDFDIFIRTIHNPFFGKARHLVRIPFLVMEHELYGYGIAEQIEQFQDEASTSHNQVIDAGTAANAALIAVSPDAGLDKNLELYPGKQITLDKPKDNIQVFHLGADSRVLGTMEEKAIRYAEARSGVSSYHLGMESTVVGSRATATGTTALIGEGNLRFWMSIDDVRHAVEECLYLTIQLEQQMRPAGYEWAPGRFIQFPRGDVRTSLGLKLTLTSEKINKDIELQNLQMLMQILENYYMRLMQAGALMQNPMVSPVHKMVIVQTMEASMNLIKRFVERFEVEDIDSIVPNLMDIVNRAMRIISTMPAQMGENPNGPQAAPGQAPAGLPPAPPGVPQQ